MVAAISYCQRVMANHRPPENTAIVIFALALLVTPILAVVSALALAPVAGILGLVALAAAWRGDELTRIPWAVLALPAALAIWATASLIWSPLPGLGASTLLRVGLLTLGGMATVHLALRIPARWLPLLAVLLTIGCAIGLSMLSGEALTDNGLSGWYSVQRGMKPLPHGAKSQMNRGATVLAVLIWPIVLLLWRQRGRWWALALGAFALATLWVGDSMAAHLALSVGCAVFALAMFAPRAIVMLVRAGLVALVLAGPVAALHAPTPPATVTTMPWLASSAHHRLLVWQFAATRIAERPLLGWGMDGSRAIPGGDEPINVQWRTPTGEDVYLTGPKLPLHPHNAVLQWWLELGLVGALLMTTFLWQVAGLAGCLTRPSSRAAALACFTAGLTVSMVSYGWWQNWWQAALWLGATLCALQAGADGKADRCTSSS